MIVAVSGDVIAAIIIAVIVIGGEVAMNWLGDRVTPASDAPLWKRLTCYALLLLVLWFALNVWPGTVNG